MAQKFFVCGSGTIGAGKTTVATLTQNIFGFELFKESVEDNPYLPLFYRDMQRWSYKLQRFFLITRFVAHERMLMHPVSVVQDRSIYEDMEIFARLQMKKALWSDEQIERYKRFCDLVYREIEPPDLIIFLKASVPVVKERIRKRGRDYEADLLKDDNDYLDQLDALYEQWVRDYKLSTKITIDTDNLNIIDNPEDLKTMVNKIKRALVKEESRLDSFV